MQDTVYYTSTLSSNGKQTTNTASTIITFVDPDRHVNVVVSYLTFEAFVSSCFISINEESTRHEVDANSSITLANINIEKLTIYGSGVQYRWTALRR